MEPTIYMEIGAIILGFGLLVIGIIDYVRCKFRRYGENPPRLFKKGKR